VNKPLVTEVGSPYVEYIEEGVPRGTVAEGAPRHTVVVDIVVSPCLICVFFLSLCGECDAMSKDR